MIFNGKFLFVFFALWLGSEASAREIPSRLLEQGGSGLTLRQGSGDATAIIANFPLASGASDVELGLRAIYSGSFADRIDLECVAETVKAASLSRRSPLGALDPRRFVGFAFEIVPNDGAPELSPPRITQVALRYGNSDTLLIRGNRIGRSPRGNSVHAFTLPAEEREILKKEGSPQVAKFQGFVMGYRTAADWDGRAYHVNVYAVEERVSNLETSELWAGFYFLDEVIDASPIIIRIEEDSRLDIYAQASSSMESVFSTRLNFILAATQYFYETRWYRAIPFSGSYFSLEKSTPTEGHWRYNATMHGIFYRYESTGPVDISQKVPPNLTRVVEERRPDITVSGRLDLHRNGEIGPSASYNTSLPVNGSSPYYYWQTKPRN